MYKNSREQNKHKCSSRVTEMEFDLVNQTWQKQLPGRAVSVSVVHKSPAAFCPFSPCTSPCSCTASGDAGCPGSRGPSLNKAVQLGN